MSNRWKGGFVQAYFDPLASGAGWKQFSGQWTVTQAAQARGAGTWPEFPGAPTIGTATKGNAQASVVLLRLLIPAIPLHLPTKSPQAPALLRHRVLLHPLLSRGLLTALSIPLL
jgi:hypothetical protein